MAAKISSCYVSEYVLAHILDYLGDFRVTNLLKDHIPDQTWQRAYDAQILLNECVILSRDKLRILIYGSVQSGKSGKIMHYFNVLQRIPNPIMKILVVPNSLLLMNQYKKHLDTYNKTPAVMANPTLNRIEYQAVDSNTAKIHKKTNLILVMGNKYRFSSFYKLQQKFLQNTPFVLFVDEADLCLANKNIIPLLESPNLRTHIDITATPYSAKFKKIKYDKIDKVVEKDNYFGINRLDVVVEDDFVTAADNFVTQTPTGIMLFNRHYRIADMQSVAEFLATRHPTVPVILLSTEKTLYIQNQTKHIAERSVSKIIDKFAANTHIFIIGNRLCSRAISYVSSDYTRHVTHQVTRVKTNIASFAQSLRICGCYEPTAILKLYITSQCEHTFNTHKAKLLDGCPCEETPKTITTPITTQSITQSITV